MKIWDIMFYGFIIALMLSPWWGNAIATGGFL